MRKVPELRFDSFDGEWEEKTFNDLAEYKKGPFGSSLKKEIFVPKSNSTVKVYEQKNAIEKDWKLERYFITFEYYQKMKSFSVGPGDIIVSCAGTIGEMYELPKDSESGIINQALMKISINTNIDKTYFMLIFDKMITKFSVTKSNGSAIKNIPPFRDLKPARTLIPTENEQEKIGNLFRKIDDLIEVQEGKVSKMRDYKKSMLQKMFPKKDELVPEFRFDGFDGDLNSFRINELMEYSNGNTLEPLITENGDLEVLNLNSVSINGQLKGTSKYISSPYPTLEKNDIIMILSDIAHGNLIGKTAVIPESNKYVLNQRVAQLKPKNIDSYFLSYYINHNQKDLYALSAGTSQLNLSKTEILKYYVRIPSLEEQQKIGQFFKNLDTQIENEEKLLESYKMMKKSLLQKMFV